jgi:hypothetical protein
MALIGKADKYKWTFANIGGTTRVKISTGEDLAHLSELDPKMWTVLSCPVKGLEIDEKSLMYMDTDSDGKIRLSDVISTSEWMVSVLKDPALLLEGKDSIDIENFNQSGDCGAHLYKSAKHILEALGKEGTVITMADIADMAKVYANTRYNGDGVITEGTSDSAEDKAAIAAAVKSTGGTPDRSGAQGVNADQIEAFYKDLADYAAWCAAEVEAPFGDKTDAVIAAYHALDAKVQDFFVRSKLAAFSPESVAALDVKTSQIEGISADNLADKSEQIALYPLVRINGKPEIDLGAAVNPAWADKFALVRTVAIPAEQAVLTLEDWKAVGAKFAPYVSWKSSKAGASVEGLGLELVKTLLEQDRKKALMYLVAEDSSVSEEVGYVETLNKFIYIYRDFYRLVRNFVTLHDFYDKDQNVKAIFQAGTLLVDQRECRFCMKVEDVGKHSAAAPSSGMFLIYCDCTSKNKPGKLTIVAAVTVGEIGDLVVGKNAVYYDNDGQEWDAVITKIVENPISISQAFWSPYRRLATAIETLINKNAADKDATLMKDMTAKINAAPASLPAAGSDTGKAAQAAPFDIGKFAGIFAALGMAVGMIGTALASLAKGIFALKWWQVILSFVGVLLVVSGPAMIMAWLKLRRRNIAPLLNANGWAVNASSKISIPFGETLTDQAKYPKLKLVDPYARKGMAPWKKWTISFASLVVVLAALWLANMFSWANLPSPLPCFNKTEVVEEVVEEAAAEGTVVEECSAEQE